MRKGDRGGYLLRKVICSVVILGVMEISRDGSDGMHVQAKDDGLGMAFVFDVNDSICRRSVIRPEIHKI